MFKGTIRSPTRPQPIRNWLKGGATTPHVNLTESGPRTIGSPLVGIHKVGGRSAGSWGASDTGFPESQTDSVGPPFVCKHDRGWLNL